MWGLSKTPETLQQSTPDTTLSGAPAQHHGFIHFLKEHRMKNAISWFEIPTTRLDRAQAFYEAVLGHAMRREAMGPSQGVVFAYDPMQDGTGGALMMRPTAPAPSASGVLVYLDASPSLDAALERVQAQGGRVSLPRQALPPGMGFFAHIHDLDGNRVGLHALA
jgi:predicted enzyme related to lactoylglutathione lyase